MKNKKRFFYLWILVNALLFIRFLVDPFLINCEPCIPNLPCPSCRTSFANSIWIYLLLWNGFYAFVFFLKKYRQKELK